MFNSRQFWTCLKLQILRCTWCKLYFWFLSPYLPRAVCLSNKVSGSSDPWHPLTPLAKSPTTNCDSRTCPQDAAIDVVCAFANSTQTCPFDMFIHLKQWHIWDVSNSLVLSSYLKLWKPPLPNRNSIPNSSKVNSAKLMVVTVIGWFSKCHRQTGKSW